MNVASVNKKPNTCIVLSFNEAYFLVKVSVFNCKTLSCYDAQNVINALTAPSALQQAKNYIRSLPKVPKKDLHYIFSKASSNGTVLLFVHLLVWPHDADLDVYFPIAAVCVLERMLLLDPECRASASEALELPFFNEFRDIEEETEALPYDQTMDNTDLPLDQWKREQEPAWSFWPTRHKMGLNFKSFHIFF